MLPTLILALGQSGTGQALEQQLAQAISPFIILHHPSTNPAAEHFNLAVNSGALNSVTLMEGIPMLSDTPAAAQNFSSLQPSGSNHGILPINSKAEY